MSGNNDAICGKIETSVTLMLVRVAEKNAFCGARGRVCEELWQKGLDNTGNQNPEDDHIWEGIQRELHGVCGCGGF